MVHICGMQLKTYRFQQESGRQHIVQHQYNISEEKKIIVIQPYEEL